MQLFNCCMVTLWYNWSTALLHICLHNCDIFTLLHTYILTQLLHTYILTYLHNCCILTYLHTYTTVTCLHNCYILTYLHTNTTVTTRIYLQWQHGVESTTLKLWHTRMYTTVTYLLSRAVTPLELRHICDNGLFATLCTRCLSVAPTDWWACTNLLNCDEA